jgi:hypothetical protein
MAGGLLTFCATFASRAPLRVGDRSIAVGGLVSAAFHA